MIYNGQDNYAIKISDIYERRKHVHVTDSPFTKICKFWIEKNGRRQIDLDYNKGFKQKEINVILEHINKNIDYIEEQLNNFYNGKRIINKKINR